MAKLIYEGQLVEVIDLAVVADGAEVYGVAVGDGLVVDLGSVEDGTAGVYGVEVWTGAGMPSVVDLGSIDQLDVLYGPSFLILPGRSYRRIQLDGGGRILLEACVGDERVEQFFELWRNGRPFPLYSVSNPVFSWKSPAGQTGEAVARIVEPAYGRIGVRLFDPIQVGVWLVQVAFVDEINFDGERGPDSLDESPPYAPAPGAQEFWRRLPKALRCIVRAEGGW